MKGLGAESSALLAETTVYEPGGCADCGQSGYRGRTGVFEVLRVTERIEELVVRRAPTAGIRSAAQEEGMRTLRQAGLLKVQAGDTSIAEVFEHTVDRTDEVGPDSQTPVD